LLLVIGYSVQRYHSDSGIERPMIHNEFWRPVMNKAIIVGLALAMPVAASAQDSSQTLAATMDVFVFPAAGQDSSQQSKDEVTCYEWAGGNTRTDPFALGKQEQADQQQAQADMQAAEQAGQGAGARGAVRGAAAGALIGEIANDDAGEGAAWGAAAGAIRGRRVARYEQQQAQQEAAAKAEQRQESTAGELDNFKKAFSVCLEAKEYMVKY
jgi:hypothetical protein